MIFVVGATKGGTENSRVGLFTLELLNKESINVNGYSHWKFDAYLPMNYCLVLIH